MASATPGTSGRRRFRRGVAMPSTCSSTTEGSARRATITVRTVFSCVAARKRAPKGCFTGVLSVESRTGPDGRENLSRALRLRKHHSPLGTFRRRIHTNRVLARFLFRRGNRKFNLKNYLPYVRIMVYFDWFGRRVARQPDYERTRVGTDYESRDRRGRGVARRLDLQLVRLGTVIPIREPNHRAGRVRCPALDRLVDPREEKSVTR